MGNTVCHVFQFLSITYMFHLVDQFVADLRFAHKKEKLNVAYQNERLFYFR